MITSPQATNAKGHYSQRGRGGRGGYRGRGGRGRGRGGLMLCYWCRDFLPKEQANHKWHNALIKNRPNLNIGKTNLALYRKTHSQLNPILRKLARGTTMKSCKEVLVDSPNDSKPLKEIKQMLNLEKESSQNDLENQNSHAFNPTPRVRNDLEGKKETVLLLTI